MATNQQKAHEVVMEVLQQEFNIYALAHGRPRHGSDDTTEQCAFQTIVALLTVLERIIPDNQREEIVTQLRKRKGLHYALDGHIERIARGW